MNDFVCVSVKCDAFICNIFMFLLLNQHLNLMSQAQVNSEAIISALIQTLERPQFAIKGNDKNKAVTTLLLLLTNSKFIAEFDVDEYNAHSEILGSICDYARHEVQEADEGDVAVPSWKHCDCFLSYNPESKRIINFEHAIIQLNSFQANGINEDECQLKGYNLSWSHQKSFNEAILADMETFGIERNANDGIIGLAVLAVTQHQVHQRQYREGVHPLFGDISEGVYEGNKRYSRTHDEEADNVGSEQLLECPLVLWIISDAVIYIYIDMDNAGGPCIYYVQDDIYALFAEISTDAANLQKATKQITFFPFKSEIDIKNAHIIRSVLPHLPLYSAKKANTKLWTDFLLNAIGNQSICDCEWDEKNGNCVIKFILFNKSWMDTKRQQAFKACAETMKKLFVPNSSCIRDSQILLAKNLRSICFAHSQPGTYKYAYDVIHKSPFLKKQLLIKHKPETVAFLTHLSDLYSLFLSDSFKKYNQMSAAKQEYLKNVCLSNEYGVSNIFGNFVINVEGAASPLIRREFMLLIGCGFGYDLRWYEWEACSQVSDPENLTDDARAALLELMKNCVYGNQLLNAKQGCIPLHFMRQEFIRQCVLTGARFASAIRDYAFDENAKLHDFAFHHLFDKNGNILKQQNKNKNKSNRNTHNNNSQRGHYNACGSQLSQSTDAPSSIQVRFENVNMIRVAVKSLDACLCFCQWIIDR